MPKSARFFVIGVSVTFLTFVGSALFAQEKITYPVVELGDCASKEECRAYCDDSAHRDACAAWARAHGIATNESRTGPGGCDSYEACRTYCRERSHMEECVLFAVSEGRMGEEQADKVLRSLRGDVDIPRVKPPQVRAPKVEVEPSVDREKVQQLLKDQKGPGACDSVSACESYCNDPVHEDECFAYAVEHDLLPKEEVERIKKLRTIEGPGRCRGRACEQYCEQAGNEKECLEFAREQGFLAEDEYIKIKKFVDMEGPGGCRGRLCEQYCENTAHRKECFTFAKENGLIDEKEAEVIDRIQSKMETSGGPGGCRDEMLCREYCMDQAHFDECVAFAVDTSLIPPDHAQMMLKQFIDLEQFSAEGHPGGFRPPMMDRMGPPAGFEPMERFNKDELAPEYRIEFERRMQEFEKFREQFKEDDGMTGERMMPPQKFDGQFNMPPSGDQFVPRPDSAFPDYQQQYSDQIQSEFQKQFETQFQQEYQEQYQQQFEQQYQQQYNQYEAPPAGASPFQVFLDLFGL